MKRFIGLILVIISLSFLVISCTTNEKEDLSFKKQNNKDALNFKSEYEDLNEIKDEDGKHMYQTLDIDDDNLVVYLDYQEVIKFIDSGTGVLYFGRPACSWSRNLINTLLDFSWYNNENIYYHNIEEMRSENNEEYQELLEILDDYLPIDTVTQKEGSKKVDNKLKRITLPFMLFVKDGKVKEVYNGYQEPNLKNNNFNIIEEEFNDYLTSIK